MVFRRCSRVSRETNRRVFPQSCHGEETGVYAVKVSFNAGKPDKIEAANNVAEHVHV